MLTLWALHKASFVIEIIILFNCFFIIYIFYHLLITIHNNQTFLTGNLNLLVLLWPIPKCLEKTRMAVT